MSIPIEFERDDIKGYIDSTQPVSGWILAKNKIEHLWIEHKGKLLECTYGFSRSDVVKRVNKQKDFPAYENCGFRESVLTLLFDETPITILVKLDTNEIRISRPITLLEAENYWLDPKAPLSSELAHPQWIDFLVNHFNKPNVHILEIGARCVTGSRIRPKFDLAHYTGFDIEPGVNVDVVGDAHMLSEYFSEKFDLIFSSAVFEHFALPWVVAEEICKCLKSGGYIFVETHYSYKSHERPWHFFQFSEKGLAALFNEKNGIQCISAGVSTPLIAYFSSLSASYLCGKQATGLYCHSQFLGKKIKDVNPWQWDKDVLKTIYGNTSYPHRPENFK